VGAREIFRSGRMLTTRFTTRCRRYQYPSQMFRVQKSGRKWADGHTRVHSGAGAVPSVRASGQHKG